MSDSPSVGWREMRDEMGVADGHDAEEDDEWEWSPSIVFDDGSEADIKATESMTDRRRREVVDLLKDGESMTRPEIQRALGTHHHLALDALWELMNRGDVVRERDPTDRRHVVYRWIGDGQEVDT